MSNDPLKKYWEKRAAELPHHAPAHELRGKMPEIPDMPSQGIPQQNWADRDVTSQLQQRVAQKAAMGGGMGFGAQQAPSSGKQVVDLLEGYAYYTILQGTTYGNTVTLAKTGGIIGGVSSKGVTIEGEKRCLVVDNMKTVDIGSITEKSDKFVNLIEVTVPLRGTFLVQREAIANRHTVSLGNGRQLLKG